MRYRYTGDDRLLNEAIDLQRKALVLRPQGHPKRASACGALAGSLTMLHERSGDQHAVIEIIALEREALSMRPEGSPDRGVSCGNLAISLRMQYDYSNDERHVLEAIDLDRKALGLRPQGHPDRGLSCGNLAGSLTTRWKLTHEEHLLKEVASLRQEAYNVAPARAKWRHLCSLSWVRLQSSYVLYDVTEAIFYLAKSLELDLDDIHGAVAEFVTCLDSMWYHDVKDKRVMLTAVYERVINLLPLLTNPAFDLQPQLKALRKSAHIGSDSFVNAVLAETLKSGLETFDLAQGLAWSQSLHRRDPLLQGVPEPMAKELETLLKDIATRSVTQQSHHEQRTALEQDQLYTQSSRAYALAREIRALPGLDRFMLGETFETLRTTALHYPVIVLVSAREYFYALIIASSKSEDYKC
jgi:hypothetical protein